MKSIHIFINVLLMFDRRIMALPFSNVFCKSYENLIRNNKFNFCNGAVCFKYYLTSYAFRAISFADDGRVIIDS